jgi:drug/metabolite transporter (DMT)-like permease
MNLLSQKTKVAIAFFAIYIVWGSTFLFVKIGLRSFPPFLFSTFRFLIGGLLLVVFTLWKKENFPALKELPKFILSGIVVFMGGVVAVVWAQQFISSSLAAAIITTPFWFIILDRKKWSFYFANKRIIIGLLLGLSGVLLLASQKQPTITDSTASWQLIAIGIIIAGSFFWVAGALYLKERPSKSSIYSITAIQLLSASVACGLIALLNGEFTKMKVIHIQPTAWLALAYLGIVSTALTYLAFMWLIKIKPPAVVSTYAYINPLVATLLGWLFLNETISLLQLIALVIILLGVLGVNIGKSATNKTK